MAASVSPASASIRDACFAGAKPATRIRRPLDQRIERGGDAILDQVVVKINAKGKASSNHTIALDSITVEHLCRHLARLDDERRAFGSG